MRDRTRPICVLLALALLSGCSDDSKPPADDGPIVTDDLGAGETRRDAGTADRKKADRGAEAQVCGKLVDSNATAVAKGDVIICIGTDICVNATADDTGAFCAATDKPGDYLFHAVEKTIGTKHYADVLFPLAISATDISSRNKIDVGPVVQPLIAKTVALDPATGGTLDLDTSAKLVVPANATVLPPLKSSADVGFAAVVPSKVHPRLLGSRPGSPAPAPNLAYVISPFEVGFVPPATLQVHTPISASTVPVVVYHASNSTGKLESLGTTTITNGLLDIKIPGLGWYLVYNP